MNFSIVKNRMKFIAVSVIIIVCGIAAMAYNGAKGNGIFNFDIEFTGGTAVTVDMGKEFDNDELAAVCADVTGQKNPQIQKILGTNEASIKLQSIDGDTRTKLSKAIVEKFSLTDDSILSVQDISATVSGEMQKMAFIALLVSCAAMLIYITIRFKDFKTGLSSIFALLHDVLIMLSFYAIFRVPVNNAFIAALLTVVGYSINATIVIFSYSVENNDCCVN